MPLEAIEIAIAKHFDFRHNIIVTNLSWGMLNHEADVVVMSKSGYLTEVEIKRSWSDFLADFRKKHDHRDPLISSYYYAVPISISEKVKQKLHDTKRDAQFGLLAFGADKYGSYVVCLSAAPSGNKRKLTDAEQFAVARLGALHVWTLKKKIIKLQQNG